MITGTRNHQFKQNSQGWQASSQPVRPYQASQRSRTAIANAHRKQRQDQSSRISRLIINVAEEMMDFTSQMPEPNSINRKKILVRLYKKLDSYAMTDELRGYLNNRNNNSQALQNFCQDINNLYLSLYYHFNEEPDEILRDFLHMGLYMLKKYADSRILKSQRFKDRSFYHFTEESNYSYNYNFLCNEALPATIFVKAKVKTLAESAQKFLEDILPKHFGIDVQGCDYRYVHVYSHDGRIRRIAKAAYARNIDCAMVFGCKHHEPDKTDDANKLYTGIALHEITHRALRNIDFEYAADEAFIAKLKRITGVEPLPEHADSYLEELITYAVEFLFDPNSVEHILTFSPEHKKDLGHYHKIADTFNSCLEHSSGDRAKAVDEFFNRAVKAFKAYQVYLCSNRTKNFASAKLLESVTQFVPQFLRVF